MRLRNVPGSTEIIRNHPNCVNEPEEYKGKWSEYFAYANPLHMEIGPGKGKFIISLARENQDINYISIEKYAAVLVKLVNKIKKETFPNLAILHADADNLLQLFNPGEISKIYLNFSDPWPKKKHAKRRLTNPRFLEMYKTILKDDGIIAFKTDNRDFFDYSVEQFKLAGFLLGGITYDLHNSPLAENNITTEYEDKFTSQGMPIYALVAYKRS